MLTDRVVVKPEMLGQFGDVDRLLCVGDVAEQFVPRRITERSCLALQVAHRPPATLNTDNTRSRITTPAINRFAFHTGCVGPPRRAEYRPSAPCSRLDPVIPFAIQSSFTSCRPQCQRTARTARHYF